MLEHREIDAILRGLTPLEHLQLVHENWRAGDLRFLLLPHLQEDYDAIKKMTAKKRVNHSSRRRGKTSLNLVLAMETCLKIPGARVPFGAAQQKDVREMIVPLMKMLLETCPEDIKFDHIESKNKFICRKNGSEIVASGIDKEHADNLRGTKADLIVLDEAGFADALEYAIKDVLMAQTLTTGAPFIISSTSPKTLNYFVSLVEEARHNNAYIKRTIYEDSRPEIIARIPEFMKEAGGADSTTWKREYLSEIVVDETRALIPEFSKPDIRERCVQEVERPAHLISYSVIDTGHIDNTGILIGYTDFKNAKRIILDEFILERANTKEIADACRTKEDQVWGKEKRHDLRRYADGQPLTIADLNSLHGFTVTKCAEDIVEAKVNRVRIDLMEGRLIIHPRCKRLISELTYGIWDDARRKFARIEGFGHFDLLSALTYFCRHASVSENPWPVDFGFDPSRQQHSIRLQREEEAFARSMRDALNLDKRY